MTQTVQGLNLKNIVADFQLLADRHKQINSFGFGDTDEFTYQVDRRDKEVNPSDQAPYYPYFYVVPSNVIQEFNFMTYEFQLIVSDIMKRDMDNMTDILSDTLQIMNDVISMFRLSYTEANGNYNEFYYVDEAVTLIPFIERYEDLLCGYSATLRIKTRTPLDRCVAAFNDFPIETPCISPSPTPSITPSPTPTNTGTPTNTPTQTPTNTQTSSPTTSPTITPTNTTTPTSTPTNTPTPTTPITFSPISLCTINGSDGFASINDICSGTCTPRTVYVSQSGVTTFQEAAITYGLPIYTSTTFIPANLYDGNSLWFGTTDKSEIFQVDNDGEMSLFGSCS